MTCTLCHSEMTNISERSWQLGEVSEDWKKVNVTPVFKNCSPLHSWKGNRTTYPEIISSGRQGHQEVNIDSTKGNHALPTWLTSMMRQLPRDRWEDREDERQMRGVHTVHLDSSKVFDTLFHIIFLGKLRKPRLDEWMMMWIENLIKRQVLEKLCSVSLGLAGGLQLLVTPKGCSCPSIVFLTLQWLGWRGRFLLDKFKDDKNGGVLIPREMCSPSE